jgi:cytoskeletal protein CcmA (bactofilin family)/ribosomal protein S27E
VDESAIAEAAQTGFGAFLQTVSKVHPATEEPAFPSVTSALHPAKEESQGAAASTPAHLTRIRTSAKPTPTLIPSVPVSPPDSTLERMRAQSSYRQGNFKEVECFECGHRFKVSRSSKTAECSHCGATVCLEDFDINLHHTTPIRTRGDVTIRKPGRVTTSQVECKSLFCQGKLAVESLHCRQDAVFRAGADVEAEIACQHLIVEKGADVTFVKAVHAEDMTLNGRVTGTLQAKGKITIGINGSVNGDITAGAVLIEPGGELNGAMNIVRARPASTPGPSALPPP